ncbi:MAG TPA: phosphoribosyl-AMP cyclohydrolase [Planctomycetota bacterium]|jgi:phosphoribosyl-AMP cyclohydrolase|nr:phosphoribosyl-AMP cyclohydrolase [Planctomycetota bacterium]OQC21155.1 MAG: phosphoribosyl-AMP cyclohydrolase [Planctomycetes bacterium ADurb.Bin069]NMD36307.1 phosphoribosyl-AMP cyclohydrolase [Planctomycetota bacterium]HNR99766.1 phosphoribosyl-AMP cyclohydrolase [Planctomycetota bacterium]HNU27219.1 phosphoribosyl-AMP cyclohydrolase [Planctomycetota bacterium]
MNAREEETELRLDFRKIARVAAACEGVIPVAVQNADTGEVILVAYTNRTAFRKSMQTRRLVLWSTTRRELWEKGATSGETFALVEARVNCEQNSLLYKVRPARGGICHTRNARGAPRNCFYRRIDPATGALEHLDP